MQDDLAAPELGDRPRLAARSVRQREQGKWPSNFEGTGWPGGRLSGPDQGDTGSQHRRGSGK